MGATPIGEIRDEGGRVMWSNEKPAAAPRREIAAWGYVVHPALMPTVFAPSGSAPDGPSPEDVVAHRV